MIRHLPNFLTCCNLVTGSIGVVYLLQNPERNMPAAAFVWIALAFDFLDGFTARVLKVASPIGKELDSLADVVSFGLLPSVLVYTLLKGQTDVAYLPWIAFVIVVFSALRLAKFNIDEAQTHSFRGLPTPANALFITGLPFLDGGPGAFMLNPYVLVAVAIIFSLLLVSRVELFALKFRDLTWRHNQIQFIFLMVSVVLVALFRFAAVPLIILSYIVLSLSKSAVPGPRAD
ncbi:MAG: CDP-diacylglycerol--serine O-phosphatidyltransferase [Bacteroidota bacterium]|jgi:CDP-diacylglycerol--serine O-phosphatidyltransferase|nr:MAG: CDP-diacylglycerol--serine O-phosphatidyltransferase [Bacteroidota bacterium]